MFARPLAMRITHADDTQVFAEIAEADELADALLEIAERFPDRRFFIRLASEAPSAPPTRT